MVLEVVVVDGPGKIWGVRPTDGLEGGMQGCVFLSIRKLKVPPSFSGNELRLRIEIGNSHDRQPFLDQRSFLLENG